jgi:subtilisin family serine protease
MEALDEPAAWRGVIAVAATDGTGLASFTSVGPEVAVAAPGVNVRTYKGAKLGPISGTTPSAAAVAGVVALMLGVNPSLSPEDVRAILDQTSTKTIPGQKFGIVNAEKAVAAARTFRSGYSGKKR